MEVSEKDIARAKYRSSKSRSRGRGKRPNPDKKSDTAPAAPSALKGDQKVPNQTATDSKQSLTEEQHSAQGNQGPQKRSQGADLAQLLKEAELHDPGSHSRFRAFDDDVIADFARYRGPLPEAPSIDLTALDACLRSLPLCRVLGIGEEYLPLIDTGLPAGHPEGPGGVDGAVEPRGPSGGGATHSEGSAPRSAPVWEPPRAAPTAAAAAELARGGVSGASQPSPMGASAAAAAEADPLDQLLREKAAPQPPAAETASDDLDALLGMGPLPPPQQQRGGCQPLPEHGQPEGEQSIEDWLSSL